MIRRRKACTTSATSAVRPDGFMLGEGDKLTTKIDERPTLRVDRDHQRPGKLIRSHRTASSDRVKAQPGATASGPARRSTYRPRDPSPPPVPIASTTLFSSEFYRTSPLRITGQAKHRGETSNRRFTRHDRRIAEPAIREDPHRFGRRLVLKRHEAVGSILKDLPGQAATPHRRRGRP